MEPPIPAWSGPISASGRNSWPPAVSAPNLTVIISTTSIPPLTSSTWAAAIYQQKRNHLNSFQRSHRQNTYEALTPALLTACQQMAREWCEIRRCEEDLSLMEEWDAVAETLAHFEALGLTGGAVFVAGRLEAFTVGEKLNDDTVVIHLEKANPEVRGLYTAINQAFLEHAWEDTPWVNREQDLGEPGLRKAKLSYHPHHLEEKFTIRLTS